METMTNHNSSNDNNDRNGYNVWIQLTQFELGPRQSKQNGLEDHPEYFKRCGYRVLWMVNERITRVEEDCQFVTFILYIFFTPRTGRGGKRPGRSRIPLYY